MNIDPSIKTAIDDAGSLADQVKQEKLEDITGPNTVSVNLQAISNEELAVREVNPAESVILELNSTSSINVDNLDSN